MDLGDWLRSLGLEQYEAAFRENAIDDRILPKLTAEDLKDLGVGLVGHRRQLLDAIATLRTAVRTNLEQPGELSNIEFAKDNAERRHITVMFSDLVDSTSLSGRMDPEDLRDVISSYQQCVAKTVHRFGGLVARYMGDGVLVYFGYPEAHEDDAERAVRAGVDLVAAVVGLKTRAVLQARVGIATGLVVVGDLIGSREVQDIVGVTPNLAARLQTIAEPNTVVIDDSTRKLLGNLFEFNDLGFKNLKGIEGATRAWAALRAKPVESRFEALHVGGLTALVGRDEETELLARRWSKAKGGDGQVVLLSGEAGIGKSRLTAALLEHLVTEPLTRLRYFCSPQHTNSALFPITSQMERAAGLAHDDTIKAKLDKLDVLLARTSTSVQDATLFAEMLSLTNDGRYPAIELTPQQRRQRTLEALTAQMAALTRTSPVLMIFEDVHWIDPTSLEALGRTVDQIRTMGGLLIITFRPDFDPPWIGRPYVTALTVNRLGQHDIDAMIDSIAGNKLLLANIRQDIIERTDGVPLFVEEMTTAVLELETGGQARLTAAPVTSPAQAVPASLHASLMARLDRLGPGKEVAQIGAAIGREFSYAILAAVTNKPEEELALALDRLVAAGLLFCQGVPPTASYLFKHALVQDIAYGTLLRQPRRLLHARIADVLESKFAEIAESQPQLLARHCTEGGLIEKAANFWGKAGQRSLSHSALVEAVQQLTQAIDQIATLPATAALRREQIKLQVALMNTLFHVKGYAAPETKAAAEQARILIGRAEELDEAQEDPLLLFSVLYGFWVANLVAFNGHVCCDLAVQFLSLAERQGKTVPLMVGHHILGISLLSIGNIAEGRAHYDLAISLYEPIEHRSLATRFGQDSRVVMLSRRSAALWLLGHPETAVAEAEHALKDARESGHAATLLYALSHGLFARYETGDYVRANSVLDELVALADEKGTLFWKAFGIMNQGCARALIGQSSDAVRMITSGLGARQSTGLTMWMPFFLSHLAYAHAQLEEFDDAWRWIGEAITAVEATEERWCEAEVYRIAGEITLVAPERDVAKAEGYLQRALTVAREQQAKSWELRAAVDLARLWRDQGRRDEARALLDPVYGWFTEGFDTFDLNKARSLLNDLGA
jgi:class 3 adenylate cyclase/predicted ATPase